MAETTPTLSDTLLEAVRNYLDITWTDANGDKKLTGIISRGMVYLDSVAGEACDYAAEGKPRELLFDYCRYVRSGALDEFETNYLSEILSLQNSVMISESIDKSSLTALTIGELTLSPAFSSSVYEYTATTVNDSDTLMATAKQPFAAVATRVNNTLIGNGDAVTWKAGVNMVSVIATYGAVSLTYLVKVTR